MRKIKVILKIIICVFVLGAFYQCNNFGKECKEIPCIAEKAKLEMREEEFIKNFGTAKSTSEEKSKIKEELTILKIHYESYINSYHNSSDGYIEQSLFNINQALNDSLQNSNLKKSVYLIKIPHDNNEYLKNVYFYNNRLIAY